MKNQKLAILGASYLQLPLVLKAKELEIEIHCFAWDDDRAICKKFVDFFYPISVLDKEEILSVCQKVNINGILTIATDICNPTIAFVTDKMQLVGNSLWTAEATTNKKIMRDLLSQNGLNVPLNIVVNNSESIDVKSFSFPLIVKPIDRSGSLGVTKVNHINELKEAVVFALEVSLSKNCIIEEFIEGDEVSVETLSYKGQHQILAITDKVITKQPYFVEIEHHQPSSLSQFVQDMIKIDAIKILYAFKLINGAGHLEFKITKDNCLYLIELGSRMGGDFIGSDLVKLSTGFDYLEAVIKVSLGCFNWENIFKLNKYAGVYFLGKETANLLPFFETDNEFIVKKELFTNELNHLKSSNDRSGYIIYQANKKLMLK